MSSTPNQQLEPILNKQQLVDYLVAGCKPKNEWRIGTEHEKFLFYRNNHKPLTYDGINGIRHILTNLSRFGWKIIYENDRPIALQREGAAITLEPGG
ncbi:MAG TPA: glutamate--cysteine ligase, partial [Alphaproteobacteria bacterium]|nr:glutamate--cysteine ligase [Alphaproteobacteria bacterium]